MPNVKYKLVIEVDGSVAHTEELGHEAVRGLANAIDEPSEAMNGYLVLSPDYDIRATVARKKNLSSETVELLAASKVRDVNRPVFRRHSAVSF